jgi:hypothetical protein
VSNQTGVLEILYHFFGIVRRRSDVCQSNLISIKPLAALQNAQNLTGNEWLLTPLVKQLTEAALKAEVESRVDRSGPRFSDGRLSAFCPHLLRFDHAATSRITLPS